MKSLLGIGLWIVRSIRTYGQKVSDWRICIDMQIHCHLRSLTSLMSLRGIARGGGNWGPNRLRLQNSIRFLTTIGRCGHSWCHYWVIWGLGKMWFGGGLALSRWRMSNLELRLIFRSVNSGKRRMRWTLGLLAVCFFIRFSIGIKSTVSSDGNNRHNSSPTRGSISWSTWKAWNVCWVKIFFL